MIIPCRNNLLENNHFFVRWTNRQSIVTASNWWTKWCHDLYLTWHLVHPIGTGRSGRESLNRDSNSWRSEGVFLLWPLLSCLGHSPVHILASWLNFSVQGLGVKKLFECRTVAQLVERSLLASEIRVLNPAIRKICLIKVAKIIYNK